MKYDETEAIEKARTNKVVKDNRLIQQVTKQSYALSLMEQKAICYIVSLIKPPEEGKQTITEYTFDVVTFCKVCGIDYTNGVNYINVRNALQKLHDHSFWITEGKTEHLLSWISEAAITKRDGKIQIELSRKIMPYLYNLKERYTSYELYEILALKSGYSIKLYELMRSYAFTQRRQVFEIEQFKKLIQCPYKDYRDVRRHALEPAVKEINNYTDLDISWQPIIKGRKIIQLSFTITRKNTDESMESYRNTMATLNGIKHRQKGQINVFEFIGGAE